MVLYTGNALPSLGTVTADQMAAYIATSLIWTNIAFYNSGIDLYFNLVHVDIASNALLIPFVLLPVILVRRINATSARW